MTNTCPGRGKCRAWNEPHEHGTITKSYRKDGAFSTEDHKERASVLTWLRVQASRLDINAPQRPRIVALVDQIQTLFGEAVREAAEMPHAKTLSREDIKAMLRSIEKAEIAQIPWPNIGYLGKKGQRKPMETVSHAPPEDHAAHVASVLLADVPRKKRTSA